MSSSGMRTFGTVLLVLGVILLVVGVVYLTVPIHSLRGLDSQ